MKLSARIQQIGVSPTSAVKATATRLREQGEDIIDFGPGEPDFPTPDNVKRAATAAIADDFTHYTDTRGISPLREALADRYRDVYGSPWTADEVMTGCGGKNLLYSLFQALLDPGDEVAMFAPYWVSFPEQVRLAGGVPTVVDTRPERGFVPEVESLEAAITPRLQALVLNSPSNPTGAVIPEADLERFAELVERHDLCLISDETYEPFVYGDEPYPSFARLADRLADRLVIVGSFSKTYAMTGWRVGYALGPTGLMKAVMKLQSHSVTHTASVSQAAAVEAVRGDQGSVRGMLEQFRLRRAEIVSGLNSVPGVECAEPAGAFYVFPRVTSLVERLGLDGSTALAQDLLERCGVATVPGEAFGTAGYLRFSYALELDRIREGVERMRTAFS